LRNTTTIGIRRILRRADQSLLAGSQRHFERNTSRQ